jgi:hypothetical protein
MFANLEESLRREGTTGFKLLRSEQEQIDVIGKALSTMHDIESVSSRYTRSIPRILNVHLVAFSGR